MLILYDNNSQSVMSKRQLSIQYDHLKNSVEQEIRKLQSQIPAQLLPNDRYVTKSHLKSASDLASHRPHFPSINDHLEAHISQQDHHNQNSNNILLQVIYSQKQLTKVISQYTKKMDQLHKNNEVTLSERLLLKKSPSKNSNSKSNSARKSNYFNSKIFSANESSKNRLSYINPYLNQPKNSQFDQYYVIRQRSSNKSKSKNSRAKVNNFHSISATKLNTLYSQLQKSRGKMQKNEVKKVINKVFNDYGYRY